jgi:hypothetical protein
VPGFAQSLRRNRRLARLQPCQRDRVLRHRNQEYEQQATDRDESAEVEQWHSTEQAKTDGGIVAQRDRSDCQQNSQLGRTESAERHLEHASDCCRKEHLARDKQIRHEQRERNDGRHERRGRQPAEKQCDADDVEDVIDVEAVLRSLNLADPGERAVKTVPEPIDCEGEDDQPERACVPTCKDVPCTRDSHRRHRQPRQMV